MVARQEKAQCVSWFIETKSYIQFQRRYRTSVSEEKIHHHALQFVDGQEIYGDRVSAGCSEKWATKTICEKHGECKTSV